MSKNALGLLAQLILTLAIFCNNSFAHESRPLYIEVTERASKSFEVSLKIPPSALNTKAPYVRMPAECEAVSAPRGHATYKRQFFHCSSHLSGAEITVVWPDYNPSISTIFRLKRLSGENHSKILPPNTLTWRVPVQESSTGVASEYLLLGVEHILAGLDHLLFVACLILIAGSVKRILVTVTGFTIAHSITLTLASLGLVRVPVPAVEAIIALSIVFLAVEIARNNRTTLAWRYPVLVASTFGLLHGFGFASVLNEIGLPQTEIPVALLFFNIGVELGQIVFILFCIALYATLTKLHLFKDSRSKGALLSGQSRALEFAFSPADRISLSFYTLCIYGIGIVSSYWMITRLQSIII